MPHAQHRTLGVAGRVDIGNRPDFFTAGHRVVAAKADAKGVTEIGFQAAPVVTAVAQWCATSACAQGHAGLHLHICQRWLKSDRRCACTRVGCEGHHHRLVVDQQGLGRGVVWAQWLAVKVARVLRAGSKGAAVQQNVARDAFDAEPLHPAQQQPEPLLHQLGVALALNDQVALQYAAGDGAVHIHRRGPGVGRAQQFQSSIRGDQLHDRSRVRGAGGMPAEQGLCLADLTVKYGCSVRHNGYQCIARHLGAGQQGIDFRGQGLGTCNAAQHSARQAACQPDCPAQVFTATQALGAATGQ